MKVYTKKGDKGTTGLIGGTRVAKHHLRIEAYGTVDELNSYIGLIRDQDIDEGSKTLLIEIQDRLFTMGSMLANDPEKSKMQLPPLFESDVIKLEDAMDDMDKNLPPMKSFVLPGGHTTVSYCHVARCVCRRAERIATHLNAEIGVDELVLSYLNRLSDYLFVLARKLTLDLQVSELPWVPRMTE
jgi:cob(I)alamin adenosyltransferase